MRDCRFKSALAIFVALIAAGSAAGGASAATLLLKDTGAGATDILNTTGELTGGASAVGASAKGVGFHDVGYFSVGPDELLTSFSIISQGTGRVAEISGGEATIYEDIGGVYRQLPSTVTALEPATPGAISQLASFSGQFDLPAGNYEIVIDSFGVDTVKTQGDAKFAVELEGVSVPEPATWAMLISGLAMIGLAARRRSENVALAA